MPLKPGSTNPAVACTISPSRPSELLPSIRETMSSGISTYSCVRPSANSPGWMTNGSLALDHDLLGEVRGRVAQVDRRGAVVVEDAERVAEPQVDGGRLDQLGVPRVDHDPALVDEAADRAVGEDGCGAVTRETLSLQLARPCRHRRTRGGGSGAGLAVRAAARRARERARAGAGARFAPPSPGCSSLVGRLLDRPPDQPAERQQRHLEARRTGRTSPTPSRRMLRPIGASRKRGAVS